MRNEKLIHDAVGALQTIPELEAILLYGSYAKGKETSASDIDLLIVVQMKNPKALLPAVIKRLTAVDREGLISPRITNLTDYEPDFLLDAFRHGKLLYGKAVLNTDRMMLKPYRLISYDFSGLAAAKKVMVTKRIRGTKLVVRDKKYTYNGIRDIYGMEVFSRATLLVPEKSYEPLKAFLEQSQVKFKEKKIWLES